MKKYTEQEFIKEYGDIEVLLTSYFKYSFNYTGDKDGCRIHISVGGNSDDIYRFEPNIGFPTKISSLINDIGINYASIYKDDIQIGEFNGSYW